MFKVFQKRLILKSAFVISEMSSYPVCVARGFWSRSLWPTLLKQLARSFPHPEMSYSKEATRSEAVSVKLCTASCLCLPSSWLWSPWWGQVDFSLQLFIVGRALACFRKIHSLCVLGVECSWGFSCILAHLFINPSANQNRLCNFVPAGSARM